MKKSLFALAAMAAMGECAAAGWSRKSSDAPRGNELRALNAGGLLANIDSATLNKNTFMQCFGDSVGPDGKVTLSANPSAADVIRVMKIPAGTKVQTVIIANDRIDTNASPTLVYSLGYAPVVAADGPTAVPAYFAAAGQTNLSTAGANDGKVFNKFDPITFDKDVYLTMTVGAAGAATFAAGSIWATANGLARGVR